jgi:2,3-dihydroxybenzoate decarboxylase
LGTPAEIAGHPWFRGSAWSFGADTAIHALRLMASGLFDRYPKAIVILGHLGETLPNVMWRIDHRLAEEQLGMPASKPLNHYLRNNFYVTTSGNFYTPALVNAIANMGADRVMFSVDHPWERISDAVRWFDQVDSVSEADWERVARRNAEKLLKL